MPFQESPVFTAEVLFYVASFLVVFTLYQRVGWWLAARSLKSDEE